MAWTKEQLGAWLAELRGPMTFDRLAELTGKTRQQVISYEKGQVEPGGATLLTILEALGVDLGQPRLLESRPEARLVAEVGQMVNEVHQDLRERLDRIELGVARAPRAAVPRAKKKRTAGSG